MIKTTINDLFEFFEDTEWVPFAPDEQSVNTMSVPPYLSLPDDSTDLDVLKND